MTDEQLAAPKPPRPKYQVFVSSTYTDLHEERRAVVFEILGMRHIPAGMEDFPATDDRGWGIIKKTIDTSDYYVVIVAGRYGSIDQAIDMSWTEREYLYAREKGIPVLAFIREDDEIKRVDSDLASELIERLSSFKKALTGSHHYKKWTTKEDLAGKVGQALRLQIEIDEDSEHPRLGWYRGGSNLLISPAAFNEVARLSAENRQLHEQLATLSGAKRAELLLLNHDGKPLPDQLVVEKNYIELADETAFATRHPYSTGITSSDLEEYVRKINSLVWLNLVVENVGTTVARGVVIDINVEGSLGLVINHLEQSRGILAISTRAVNPWYFSPNEHVHVDGHGHKETASWLRQRVKSIGVKGTESLVTFGLIVSTGDSGIQSSSIMLSYSLGHEEGEPVSGNCSIVHRFKGTVKKTRDQVL